MRFHLLSLGLMASSTVLSAPLNYPGDMLSAGQQQVSTEISVVDRYVSGDYIDNANKDFTEILERDITSANRKGYGFRGELSYWFGVHNDINVGVRYGYAYDKYETSIAGSQGDAYEGDWKNEGGTDITLLGKYRYAKNTAIELELTIPACSGSDKQALCSSRLGRPQNSTQSGISGGQGEGMFQVKTGIAANWVTPMDTHWAGRVYIKGGVSSDVDGQKVASPIALGGSFSGIFSLAENHQWMLSLGVERAFTYSAFSQQVQQRAEYSTGSQLGINIDYIWDFMPQLQLKPFIHVKTVQVPGERFKVDGQWRKLEYSAGTNTSFGASLNAYF